MKLLLAILLTTSLYAEQCWLTTDNKYILFAWVVDPDKIVAVDEELRPLFIYEAINATTYICERIDNNES